MSGLIMPNRCRPTDRSRDRGSMPIALLVTLVGISLSLLLMPMALGQLQSTRSAKNRAGALHAAQAGLDVALGHIRAGRTPAQASGTGPTPTYDVGVRGRLPCGPIGGAEAGDGRYLVEIHYLAIDPAVLLAAADPYQAVTTSPDRITNCVPGAGVQVTPAYAVLFSWGTVRATNGVVKNGADSRRLHASYRFRTTNENILGGPIRVRGASGVELCMDAGSAQPAPGTAVLMQDCRAQNARQTFTYNKNLTLTLLSSQTPQLPRGMCLDAGAPHTAGAQVAFRACAASTQPAQQWGINDVANFVGTTDGVSLDGFCFTVQNPDTAGSPVVLATGYPACGGAYDNKQTFQPDAAVGAGAAGPDVGQVVNYKQFGRCLDVTDRNPSSAYLIAWPCKQAPDRSAISWNQKWVLPAVVAQPTDPHGPTGTGMIATRSQGVDYCLLSPGSTAYGAYPRVQPCPATATGNFIWTVYGKTTTYATSYQIRAGPKPSAGSGDPGICLTAADPTAQPPELYESSSYRGPPISKIVMRPCSGSTWQKWNAPPNLLDPSPLKDFGER